MNRRKFLRQSLTAFAGVAVGASLVKPVAAAAPVFPATYSEFIVNTDWEMMIEYFNNVSMKWISQEEAWKRWPNPKERAYFCRESRAYLRCLNEPPPTMYIEIRGVLD